MDSARTLGEAAVILGVDTATLYRKRKAWGLPKPKRAGRRKAKVATFGPPVEAPKRTPGVYDAKMLWPVTTPGSVPVAIHNLSFWSVLRIGLRLLEPKEDKAALWVKFEALEILECLPTWQGKPLDGKPRDGNHVGWLGVQQKVPMLMHFTGWNVYLDDNMSAPFEMRDAGRTIKGAFV